MPEIVQKHWIQVPNFNKIQFPEVLSANSLRDPFIFSRNKFHYYMNSIDVSQKPPLFCQILNFCDSHPILARQNMSSDAMMPRW